MLLAPVRAPRRAAVLRTRSPVVLGCALVGGRRVRAADAQVLHAVFSSLPARCALLCVLLLLVLLSSSSASSGPCSASNSRLTLQSLWYEGLCQQGLGSDPPRRPPYRLAAWRDGMPADAPQPHGARAEGLARSVGQEAAASGGRAPFFSGLVTRWPPVGLPHLTLIVERTVAGIERLTDRQDRLRDQTRVRCVHVRILVRRRGGAWLPAARACGVVPRCGVRYGPEGSG